MSENSSEKKSTGDPPTDAGAAAADEKSKLEELKKSHLELLKSVKVLQLRKSGSSPEQLELLKREDAELKVRVDELTRLYLAVLRRQDEQLSSAAVTQGTGFIKTAALKFFSEQKVPNELWKSLES